MQPSPATTFRTRRKFGSRDGGPSDCESLSVLLVEDNPGDARLFEAYLHDSGTNVDLRREERLERGVAVLHETRPDVLVLDLGLPDSEGSDTVEAAVTAAPSVPVVVLTGQGDLEAALAAQEAGATDYLQKGELTPELAARTLRWAARQARMEAKLSQQDALVRSIAENVSGGIFRTGPTGRIEYANEAFATLFGYDRARDVQGKDLTTLYARPEERGRMMAEEGADRAEVEFRRRDGSVFVALLNAKATRSADGRMLHYDGIVTDITDQKHRERVLEGAKEEAEAAADLKSAMLANMSHEVRTPLTSIIGFTEILSEALEGEHGTYAAKAHKSSERLMKTLTSVLEISRLEAGAVQLDCDHVSLNRMVTEAIDLFEPEAEAERVTLEADLPGPAVEGSLNEDAVRRILENLVENAIKFTPRGGRVTVRVRKEDSEAVLQVEDTGVGIGEEALPKIFGAFKQESEGLSREYEGTGLGLSIVKKLTGALGGSVEVESEKGEGTCFAVRLPLRAEGTE